METTLPTQSQLENGACSGVVTTNDSDTLINNEHSSQLGFTSHRGAAFFCRWLKSAELFSDASSSRILVAGCGAGHEAAFLQHYLQACVDAIDVELDPDNELAGVPDLHFQEASVLDLPFESEGFDAVFYHHVIEHVADPALSLEEIHRVLRPSGWMFVGTPNRHRLFSSVGAHEQRHWKPSLRNKVMDNVYDWKDRLTGRFRNECGAHAGFSHRELDEMLSHHFETRIWLTKEYLRFKFADHRLARLVRLATIDLFRGFMAPSIYAMCQK